MTTAAAAAGWMDCKMQWRSISFLNSKRTSSRLELTVQFAPVPFLLLPYSFYGRLQQAALYGSLYSLRVFICIHARIAGLLTLAAHCYPSSSSSLDRRLLAAADVMDFYYYYLSVSVYIWIFYFILWMNENVSMNRIVVGRKRIKRPQPNSGEAFLFAWCIPSILFSCLFFADSVT